jgi:hypothetical protein
VVLLAIIWLVCFHFFLNSDKLSLTFVTDALEFIRVLHYNTNSELENALLNFPVSDEFSNIFLLFDRVYASQLTRPAHDKCYPLGKK